MDKKDQVNLIDTPYIQKIFQYLPLSIMVFNEKGKFVYWNKTAKELWQIEPSEDYCFFDEPMANEDGFLEKILQLKEGDILPAKELWYNTHDFNSKLPNNAVCVKASGFSLSDENGELQYIIIVHENITDAKKAEERRRKLEEHLLQSQKMDAIGQLAGGIAHDFNNQLTGIMGSADILRESLRSDKSLYELADIVLKAAERSSELTDQLLAFARKGKYKSVNINVHSVICEVLSVLEHSMHKKIIIRQHLEAPLSIVNGDPSQLNSTFLNLALNAGSAMPYGGELIFSSKNIQFDENNMGYTLLAIEPGHYIEISVRDTGVGIDNKIKNRMFEPFFTTKEKGKGTGMGLAAVYGIIKNHKGTIDVSSEKGKGTTFKIYLPVTEETEITVDQPLTYDEKEKTVEILLVDDEPVVVATTTNILKFQGYNVTISQSGRDAIEIYRKSWKKFDLVLLDIVMPEMDGLETFLEMRLINPNIKVLFLSGYSIDEAVQKIVDEGVARFVQKPFTKGILLDEISNILKQRQ
jgi:signal transduction histidine kinase/CheY-like chemotaxis protein